MPKRICAALALPLVLAASAAVAGDLLLGPGDRIRVDVFGRPDLSVEQEVQPSGKLRLPLIGEVTAAGLSLGAIESSIAGTLAQGIEVSPSVLVTAVRWRPVYVLGNVRAPHAVEYTPDLTVIKAVTLAGGFGPPGESDLSSVEAIRSHERLNTAYAQYDQLLVRKARLIAERDGSDDIQFSTGANVADRSSDVAELVDSERRLFRARQDDLQGRLRSLDRLASTYDDEITSLGKQRGALDEELKIVSADVEASEKLSAQGLELRSRNSAIQRSRLDVMSRLAENIGFVSRATANLQETEQKRATAPIEHQQDVLKELTEVQKDLMSVEEVIISESRILSENGRLEVSRKPGEMRWRETSIEVVRGESRFLATENTELNPGDVVEVIDAVDESGSGMRHATTIP